MLLIKLIFFRIHLNISNQNSWVRNDKSQVASEQVSEEEKIVSTRQARTVVEKTKEF